MLSKIGDIRRGLDAKAYLSALALALTLPDICGNLMYPKMNVGDRYEKWFDEYVSPSFNEPDGSEFSGIYPRFDGRLCYELRCAYLHSGNVAVVSKGQALINEFELCVVEDYEFEASASRFGFISDSVSNTDEDQGIKATYIRLDVRSFCHQICAAAEAFYENYGDVFDFGDTHVAIRIWRRNDFEELVLE